MVSPIPEPRLESLENRTPFAIFQCDKMGAGRVFYDVVVLKGCYSLTSGRLSLAREPSTIALADDYWDNTAPERSSLKTAGDAVLFKPATDVLVTGAARSPGDELLEMWEARVEVSRAGDPLLCHRLRVNAPRQWFYQRNGWYLSEAGRASSVPIRYELAYGGAFPELRAGDGDIYAELRTDPDRPWIVHVPNPSGTGFFDERLLDPSEQYPAVQWESLRVAPGEIDRDGPPAGFGPVARPWPSRLRFAGTYDEAWEKRMKEDGEQGLPADYPSDFDVAFFQCAHPALISDGHLLGDEQIELEGLCGTPEPFRTSLPGHTPIATMQNGEGQELAQPMALDTVHIDLDRALVHLSWRLTLPQDRDVRAVEIEMAGSP
jgi:hypothetical protein